MLSRLEKTVDKIRKASTIEEAMQALREMKITESEEIPSNIDVELHNSILKILHIVKRGSIGSPTELVIKANLSTYDALNIVYLYECKKRNIPSSSIRGALYNGLIPPSKMLEKYAKSDDAETMLYTMLEMNPMIMSPSSLLKIKGSLIPTSLLYDIMLRDINLNLLKECKKASGVKPSEMLSLESIIALEYSIYLINVTGRIISENGDRSVIDILYIPKISLVSKKSLLKAIEIGDLYDAVSSILSASAALESLLYEHLKKAIEERSVPKLLKLFNEGLRHVYRNAIIEHPFTLPSIYSIIKLSKIAVDRICEELKSRLSR